jgi:hypothetical protein
MFTWNETDVTGFFGRPPSYGEDCDIYTFVARQNGVTLGISFVPGCGDIYLDIFRDGWPFPLIHFLGEGCSHAQVILDPKKRKILDVGYTDHAVTNMGIPAVFYRGFRVYLEPQLLTNLLLNNTVHNELAEFL